MAGKAPLKKASPTQPAINSLDELNQALERIGLAKAKLDEIDAQTEAKLTEIKKTAAALAQQSTRAFQDNEEAVIAYLKKNLKLFSEQRSIKLGFGTVGFRSVTEIEISANTVAKLERLEGGEDALIIKKTANKNVLATWPDADLRKVGAIRVTEDRPFYKLHPAEMAKRQAA